MASSNIKLHYFNGAGRANQIRLVLVAGGVEFQDVHPKGFPVTPEEKAKWAELTNNTTTFSVPIMTIDEGTDDQKVYVQSSAILRKAGRLGDLKMTLKNDEDGDQEAYLTDRAIADADDLRSQAYKAFVIWGASQESADKFAKEILPKHIENLERQLVNAGGDFWGGSSTMSIADATLYDAIVFFGVRLIDGAKDIANPCGPALKAWISRVESNERIKAYLESDKFKNLSFKASKSALGY